MTIRQVLEVTECACEAIVNLTHVGFITRISVKFPSYSTCRPTSVVANNAHKFLGVPEELRFVAHTKGLKLVGTLVFW